MPRYTAPVAGELAGIPVLTNGEYEFTVGEMKPFEKEKPATDTKPAVTQFGIRTSLVVTHTPEDDEDAKKYLNKSIPHTLYMHGNSGSMNKQFAMAVLGYKANQEEEFNEKYPDDVDGNNWHVDTDEQSIGDAWKELAGKRVRAKVTSKVNPMNTDQLQNQFSFYPF